ncbi:MAG: alpha/beta fold hydrolase, partial [Bacteroidia bacterium]
FILKAFHRAFCLPYLEKWHLIIDNLLENYNDLKNRSYQFSTPIKLIWGVYDKIIPISVAEKLNNELEQTTLLRVQKSAHLPTLEQPKMVVKLIN